MSDVIIVGGGASGLIASVMAARAGALCYSAGTK